MIKFKLDIDKFKRDLEMKKKQIIEGVHDGFVNGQDYLQGIMKFYIEQEVYSKYTPTVYERTYQLRDNVVAKVVGNIIFVYVDSSGMDTTKDGVPYPYRVLEGDGVHPYEYPIEGAGFMDSRNWVEATKMEFVNHMNQSQEFLSIVRDAVRRRLGK